MENLKLSKEKEPNNKNSESEIQKNKFLSYFPMDFSTMLGFLSFLALREDILNKIS